MPITRLGGIDIFNTDHTFQQETLLIDNAVANGDFIPIVLAAERDIYIDEIRVKAATLPTTGDVQFFRAAAGEAVADADAISDNVDLAAAVATADTWVSATLITASATTADPLRIPEGQYLAMDVDVSSGTLSTLNVYVRWRTHGVH